MNNEGKNQYWGCPGVWVRRVQLSPEPTLILFVQVFHGILGRRSVWKENSKQEAINGLINLLVFIELLLSAHRGDCKDDGMNF